MSADVDALQGAVVLTDTVMCTLRNGAVDTGILLLGHLMQPPFTGFKGSMIRKRSFNRSRTKIFLPELPKEILKEELI